MKKNPEFNTILNQALHQNDLKPCPFCGGEAELVDYGFSARYKAVTCGECGARTRLFNPEIGLGGEFAAIEAWNRRVEEDGGW